MTTATKTYNGVRAPEGETITFAGGHPIRPTHPVIPFIEGDGVGRDIWRAASRVFDAAVQHSYHGQRSVAWFEVFAGEKAKGLFDDWLPADTIAALKEFGVAIKGPLTTPIGGGIRSLNVALRQVLDLYCCFRPVRHFPCVPSPVIAPDKLDVCIFRENMEDVYAGIEFPATSKEATQIIELLENFGSKVRPASAIGIKPVSEFGSKRLIRRAMQYAIDHKRSSVTLVHKGNIQKFTEGAFRAWGYELAEDEFSSVFVAEKKLAGEFAGQVPPGKIVVKDRITDAMFQELLIRPNEHSVIATTNLNGDYLSDAAAAQVGGLGIAPGANIGDNGAVFEAIHGTAPKYTDKDVINPTSVILSGAMMFQYLGWIEVHDLIVSGLVKTFEKKLVTYDLERLMSGATLLKTSEFASAIVDNMVPL